MAGLCALADVKTWLDITDSSKDAKLQLFIDRISSQMKTYLGFNPARATYTNEVHAINNNQLLYLNAAPIQAVTACSIDGVTVIAGTADDCYQFNPTDALAGRLYRGVGWCGRYFTRGMTYDPIGGARVVLVTYDAGWYFPDDEDYDSGSIESLPEAISSACMQEVVAFYNKNLRKAEGLISFSEGGVSWGWANKRGSEQGSLAHQCGLSDETVAVLSPFRRWGFA